MVACCMPRRPLPECVPISTHASLAFASITVQCGLEKGIVGLAHDILVDAIEVVDVVLTWPGHRLPRLDSDIVATDHLAAFMVSGEKNKALERNYRQCMLWYASIT